MSSRIVINIAVHMKYYNVASFTALSIQELKIGSLPGAKPLLLVWAVQGGTGNKAIYREIQFGTVISGQRYQGS